LKKDVKRKRDYIYYDLTQGMCRQCRKIIDAQIIFRDEKVYQRSICPEHGTAEALIAANAEWYLKVINTRQLTDKPGKFSREINQGCPHDCGLCTWHEKACNIPIFSITNACDLKCPICFTYNRDDLEYFMAAAEFKKIIDWIIESETHVDLVNITGGEPTLHPQLFTLLDICKKKEIGRITLNSNGLKLSQDEDFVKKLAQYGVYVILSFNTLNKNTAKKMHGKDVLGHKLKALENLEKYGVQTTLMNVSTKDLNDKEIGKIIHLALKKDFIRSVTIQNMTYTGFGGSRFMPRKHLPIDEVISNIVKKQEKRFTHEDFFPMPGSHPLCYSTCYFFQDGDYTFPLKRLFSDNEYYEILGKKYLVHPGENFQQLLTDKINEVWAEPDKYPQSEMILRTMKKMIAMLYPPGGSLTPFERQERAEKFIKTIYIHAHMDEDNFDLSRIARCGDLVPAANKTFIPACSYNLFYRMKDKRFWKPEAE
jgi:uncharacterized radical SAM superfamily Fe-S cluster-containing enzyme